MKSVVPFKILRYLSTLSLSETFFSFSKCKIRVLTGKKDEKLVPLGVKVKHDPGGVLHRQRQGTRNKENWELSRDLSIRIYRSKRKQKVSSDRRRTRDSRLQYPQLRDTYENRYCESNLSLLSWVGG